MPCRSFLVWIVLGLSLGASSVQGILEVDPDSGAVSLFFPLGPGIGCPGLGYRPALVGRFAPQINTTLGFASPGRPVQVPAGPATTAFELAPGWLEWPLGGRSGICWTYPDGTGGRVGGPWHGNPGPEQVLSHFGFAAPVGWRPSSGGVACLPSHALAGAAGECLVVLPGPTVPCPAPEGGTGLEDRIPACLLVVRSDLAYEYRYAAPMRAHGDRGTAHYRLTAVRAPSGEPVTFTYGPNGLDFEAAWMDTKVRVALDGVQAVAPVPALDDGLPARVAKDPREAFRDVEARLRITYEGLQAATRGYSVCFLLGTGDLAKGSSPVEGPPALGTLPPACREPLQVTRVLVEDPGEAVGFVYGKAPCLGPVGPEEARPVAPTVLEEIALPQRRLQLEWEPQTGTGVQALADEGLGAGNAWSYGVRAIREQGVSTYHRRSGPGPVPDDERMVEAHVPWVRQSRHFAFAPNGETGGACRTFVRDRWILNGLKRIPDPNPRMDPSSSFWVGEGDIPTFERDPREGTLVPVPGEWTRRLDWEPGADTGPDLHHAGLSPGPVQPGLRGGGPGFVGAEAQPGDKPGEIIRPTTIQYDPIRNEVTMGVIVGGPAPSGPGAPPSHLVPPLYHQTPGALPPLLPPSTPIDAVDLMRQQVTVNQQDIQRSGQEALAASARQAAILQEGGAIARLSALDQAALDARMATIQGQVAAPDPGLNPAWSNALRPEAFGQVVAQSETAQAEQRFHGTMQRIGEIQGRVGEAQRKIAESMQKMRTKNVNLAALPKWCKELYRYLRTEFGWTVEQATRQVMQELESRITDKANWTKWQEKSVDWMKSGNLSDLGAAWKEAFKDPAWGAGAVVATAAPFMGSTSTATVDGLLKPGGNFIGTVLRGATAEIRTVSSGEFATLPNELFKGSRLSGFYAAGNGTWYDLPTGGRVGVRVSQGAGLTLDIDIPGYPKGFKVHKQ